MLAELAKGTLRKKIPALRQALHGRFRDHHATLIRLGLGHLAHLEGAVAELDERSTPLVNTHTSEAGVPFTRARDRLDAITGVGKRAAECVLAEIGVDMSRSPTAAHLAPWAGTCPGNDIAGGKRGSGKTTHGDVWPLDILTNDCDDNDLGGDYFTRRNVDRQRDRLIAQLQGPGYRVTLGKAA